MDYGAVAYSADEGRSLEDLGYSFIGEGDHLATFTNLLELAQATTTARIGSFIMTSYGRHPVVAARESMKIQEVSGDRLTMTVGRGFRSAALMGRSPIPLAETKSYVESLRALLGGQPAQWDGHSIPALDDPIVVPVFISAYGPAVRRLAGEVGDGVVLAAGSSIPLLQAFLADVAEGALAAGRSPDDIEVWLLCRASVRDSRTDAMDDIRGLLAASAYRHLRASSQMRTVPPELHEPLNEFRQRYDPEGAEGYQPSWDGPNARLVHDLGLDDFLAERFAIVGTPAECRDQVAALEAAGVSRIVFAPGARSADSMYERIAGVLVGAG